MTPVDLSAEAPFAAAQALDDAARVVIKVGSSLVIDAGTRGAADAWLAGLAQDIAGLRETGKQVIVVSSGAVALGRARLGLSGNARLDEKQAAAAVGQSLLMRAWERALEPHALIAAQVLLTRDDTEQRRRWLNARDTLQALLGLGAVPVVNENDTVATEEIRYGDNDRLAARAAQLAGADLLLLLSDVNGLYSGDPRHDPAARHIPIVEALTPEVLAMAGAANAEAAVGSGGMRTKLEAARIARAAGCRTLILSGRAMQPLSALSAGAPATLFIAPQTPLLAYKAWIAGSLAPAGSLTIDPGAAEALRAGKSLLASGVRAVSGRFDKGDCVRVQDPEGRGLAVGLAAYPAEEMDRIRGRHSREIEAVVGYKGPGVAIHRDDLVLDRV